MLKEYMDATQHAIHTLAKRIHDLEMHEERGALINNQLTNPGFEYWYRGAGPFTGHGTYHADGWNIGQFGATVVTVTLEGGVVAPGSQGSAKVIITNYNTPSNVRQKLQGWLHYNNRTLSASILVHGSVANGARVWLSQNNGSTLIYGDSHTGDGTWQLLTVTLPVDAAPTGIYMGVEFLANGTYYLDNAVLSVTPKPILYSPLTPTEDYLRCLRRFQRWGGDNTLEYIAAGHAYGSGSAHFVLPFQTPMGGVPTLSYSNLTHFAVFSGGGTGVAPTSITFPYVSRHAASVYVAVASGLVAGDASILYINSTLSARLTAEWNP